MEIWLQRRRWRRVPQERDWYSEKVGTKRKILPKLIYFNLVNATSRPSHPSEGGVSQRWCESAKWISRPVLAVDWPGMTPTPPSPPRAEMMWRGRHRCWASAASSSHLSTIWTHHPSFFFSFLPLHCIDDHETYVACAAPFAYCGLCFRKEISNRTTSGCAPSHSSIIHPREVWQSFPR
ncbi:hypothetical protein BU23DRAFT_10922 [Bimuria novae-zelandiae CBS 107.79]|uniref:Uncharacterized protein n=1 Tax=Bimuria novae-zelandiae CBS 107.79 TaxID=1447943 RepID=A0A6A5VUE3_9PLEO|nr:hypothetical protein BU23DRAFT_10922 [Bimuria novae-zelandiae CBS 107.79]